MRDGDLRTNPDAVAGGPEPTIGRHRVSGTTLYAEVRGDGPAVLLIPGGAEDAEGWRERHSTAVLPMSNAGPPAASGTT